MNHGYVYTSARDPGLFANPVAAEVIRTPERTPPWIVVDHTIETVNVARWPGRLWHVEILDAEGIEQASPTAHYTRSIAVRVLGELPAARLFGDHGDEVARVLAFAAQIDESTAGRLGESRHADADQAYSRAWRRWLDQNGQQKYHAGEAFIGVLAAGNGRIRSPLNDGLSQVHRVVWDRAEAVSGGAAFFLDEEGESCLVPLWSAASAALLDTAMVLGAPTVVANADMPILIRAWRTVHG